MACDLELGMVFKRSYLFINFHVLKRLKVQYHHLYRDELDIECYVYSFFQAPESYKNVTDVVNTCEYHSSFLPSFLPACLPACLLSFYGVHSSISLKVNALSFSGHDAGISQKAIKLRPIAVIKG